METKQKRKRIQKIQPIIVYSTSGFISQNINSIIKANKENKYGK